MILKQLLKTELIIYYHHFDIKINKNNYS